MAKRKFRLLSFKSFIIIGVIFGISSLYLSYSRGTGPFSFLTNRPSINATTFNPAMCQGNAVCLATYEVSRANNNAPIAQSEPVARRIVAEAEKKKEEKKQAEQPAVPAVPTPTLTPAQVTSMCQGDPTCQVSYSVSTSYGLSVAEAEQIVKKNMSGLPKSGEITPQSAPTTCSVEGSNVPIKPGFTYATGFGLKEDGKTQCRGSDTSCPLRECIAYDASCSGKKVVCGDAYATSPTTVILPSGGGCSQYTTTSIKDSKCIPAPAPCLTASGPIPTGQMTDNGLCFNGSVFKQGEKLPTFNCGEGRIFDEKTYLCIDQATQQAKELDAGLMSYWCGSTGKAYDAKNNTCGNTLPAYIPDSKTDACTDPNRVSREGSCQIINCTEPGKARGGCQADEVCAAPIFGSRPVSRSMVCKAADTVKPDSRGSLSCQENVLSTWDTNELKYKTTYCPAGCAPGGISCKQSPSTKINTPTDSKLQPGDTCYLLGTPSTNYVSCGNGCPFGHERKGTAIDSGHRCKLSLVETEKGIWCLKGNSVEIIRYSDGTKKETTLDECGDRKCNPVTGQCYTKKVIKVGQLCASGITDSCSQCEFGQKTETKLGSGIFYCGTRDQLEFLKIITEDTSSIPEIQLPNANTEPLEKAVEILSPDESTFSGPRRAWETIVSLPKIIWDSMQRLFTGSTSPN